MRGIQMKTLLPILIALFTLALTQTAFAKLSADADSKCTKYADSALNGQDIKTRLTLGIDAIDAAAEVSLTEVEKNQLLDMYLLFIKTDPTTEADIENSFYFVCTTPDLTKEDKELIKNMLLSIIE